MPITESDIDRVHWGELKPRKPKFVVADPRRVRSLRSMASVQGQILRRRFTVRKEVRGEIAGVRIERVA